MRDNGRGGHRYFRALKDSCDEMFSIPVFGNVECLNISVASGIMLYEVTKYR